MVIHQTALVQVVLIVLIFLSLVVPSAVQETPTPAQHKLMEKVDIIDSVCQCIAYMHCALSAVCVHGVP